LQFYFSLVMVSAIHTMRFFLPLALFLFLSTGVFAQSFPNPATLSTGQGTPGNNDPLWLVSGWYSSNPPNPMGLTYTPALINNNCAPGAWVDPATLPPPTNNGNWISGASPCSSNTSDGYIYFRLTLNLPSDCNGNSVATTGSYTLYLSGYVDNQITDVFVNGTSTGISGGAYSAGSQLNFQLTGPWVAGTNYVDIQVYNFPNGGQSNPYGLLLVANSAASSVADGDNDGVADIDDACPCDAGTLGNGCAPVIATGDSVICLGESTTITAVGNGTFTWNNGATGNTITVSPTANARYSVIATASNGYQDSSVIHVTVNPLPVVTISPASPAVCAGGSVTLTGNGALGYLWSDGTVANSITVTPASTTSYSVTGADANTCTASATTIVTVNPLPVAVVTPATVAICTGDNTTLTASGGATYQWSNNTTTAAITVAPTATTTYIVIATDANNCTASASGTVTVNPLPVVTITPASPAVCIGNSATLTAGGGTSYTWSTGDNTAAVTVTPAATATYSVTATDANTCTATGSATVTVNPLPVPVVNPATATVCAGTPASLTASGGNSYNWSTGDNTAALTVTPIATTTYTVTVTDANTCSATTDATVTVNPLPVPVINQASTTICAGQSTSLTASGAVGYLWSTNETTATINVTPATTTTYTVTAADANTCTATASATVTAVPVMVVVATPVNASCYGSNDGAVNLSVSSGQSPYTYAWDNGSTSRDIAALAPGTYNVIVTDDAGCTATGTATVTEPAALVYSSTFVNPSCATVPDNGSILTTVSGGTTPYTYVWSDGSNAAQLLNAGPGSYTVTISDANGCSVTDAATLSYVYDFAIQPTPAVTISLGGSTTLGYTLTGNSGTVTTLWSPSGSLSCADCVAPVAQPNSTTTYQLLVTNTDGCTANGSVQVSVVPDYTVFVPTAFTPNNDGNNDVFSISFGSPKSVVFIEMSVYNRIGEKVFQSQEHNFAWDGTYKGAPQQPGVYTWVLKLTFLDGHREEIRKGTLTIIK
jgi:gliding motility-associated-like protein